MTTAADDDGLQDWVAEYDGEGREQMKKLIEFASAEPPQLLPPTVGSDKTDAEGRRPQCGDEVA